MQYPQGYRRVLVSVKCVLFILRLWFLLNLQIPDLQKILQTSHLKI